MTSMELSARKPFITGNWKLNPQTKAEAIELALGIQSSITGKSPCDVGLFVPFPFIDAVQNAVGDKLVVGAEVSREGAPPSSVQKNSRACNVLRFPNHRVLRLAHIHLLQMVSPQDAGAFTGGISCSMLKSIGVDWALAGHSERRTIFAETDDDINAQCLKLIESGMNVVLCIGETLQEFEKDLVGAICEVQLKKALAGISATDMSRVTIAYEPIWAIGTGKVATPEIAQDVHATCRQILVGMYGEQVANDTRILYGGSVSPESVDGLLAKPDIDGALVGGASLESEKFGRIINFEMAEAPMIA